MKLEGLTVEISSEEIHKAAEKAVTNQIKRAIENRIDEVIERRVGKFLSKGLSDGTILDKVAKSLSKSMDLEPAVRLVDTEVVSERVINKVVSIVLQNIAKQTIKIDLTEINK